MATRLHAVEALIPALSRALHKGHHGRVGVVGGSLEYCGAPFYAAMSAYKMGCDLSHIFCTEDAATPIKCFSPELIVHPSIRPGDEHVAESVANITTWLPRLDALVIGPGLGRDPSLLGLLRGVVDAAKARNTPLVFDADGLFFVASAPEIVQSYDRALLTPNVVEFERLWSSVVGSDEAGADDGADRVATLAGKLGVTILRKGEVDVISNGIATTSCDIAGSPRRCGGQGDVVSGLAGMFLSWVASAPRRAKALGAAGAGDGEADVAEQVVTAALGASALTRCAAETAFDSRGRSMTTPDLMSALPDAFEKLFPGRLHDRSSSL